MSGSRLLYRQFGADPAKSNDKFTILNFRTDCLRELKKSNGRGRTCTIIRSRRRSYSRRGASRRRNCGSWR